MRLPNFWLIVLSTFLLLAFNSSEAKAQGKLFTVNDNGDSTDWQIGDGICADRTGKCTFRAAIQEAGNDNYLNGIKFALPFPSTINLTLGELLITSNVYIAGPGARKLTIQRSTALGTANFRVFNFVPNIGSLLYLRGLTVKNGNLPNGDGGGIYVGAGNIITVSDLVVTGNTANRGGGIFNAGLLSVKRVLVNSNLAVTNQNVIGAGGGLFSEMPFVEIDVVDSTFTGNAAVVGGSIFSNSRMFLINDTVSHNTAEQNGCSIVNTANGTATVLNTIVGMDNSVSPSSLSGTFNSLGNNLITDARNSSGFANGVNNDQVSDNNAINPMLGDLTDNGGHTDTRALLNGSPAIDNGNNCIYNGDCPSFGNYRLASDQRFNFGRRSGVAVDIGAFESQSTYSDGNLTYGALRFGNRSGGTLLVLTPASTDIKQARVTNPFGNFQFTGLSFGEVYFLEVIPKRSVIQGGLRILQFESSSLPFVSTINFKQEQNILTVDDVLRR